MPQFAYRALNDAGRTVRGKISANNESDLYQQLQALGLMLLDSKAVKASAVGGAMARGISAREKIQFFVHLEQLQAAGVPLLDSLTDVRDSTDIQRVRDMTTMLLNDVNEGTPLSQAFEKHPKIFGDLYAALIAVGEESGKLTESFQHLTKHVKWEDAIKQKIMKAIRYPAIVLVIITGMLMFMMGFVVPGIVGFLKANGQTLPPVTVALIATSDFIVHYWWVILLTPIVIVGSVLIANKASEAARYALSCLALRIPVFGALITKLAISRFAHFFAVMFQSGVPILQCLETAQRVVNNRCLEESMKSVRQQVQNGEPLSQSMRNSGQFPSLVCRMVKIGEDSGNLGGVMDNVTGFYDKDVDEAIDAMIGMIEPTMTLVSGIVMGWIVIGVMGPIYDSLGKMGISRKTTMARGEFVLNIGDDNVVLVRLVDRKVANAWLGSPDPAMAQEELGEALAEDPKCRISVLIDILDQSFKEEEIPKVGVLDRRKVLARSINLAFPGQNLRGARLVAESDKKTLIYEFASVPLDGRIPGWVDFVESLPNEKGGYYAIAPENADILKPLAPNDAPVEEGKTHWRHLIGVNVTGGLRQIIEKNGRLCLTRLTQAPPPETPPADFADMIVRDFKATITYIRRLGYQVNDPLDLVVLTTRDNKTVLEELTWDGARSVSVYTPYEAGALLGLGSIGREDQAYSDVLHAAWFSSKRRPLLPLTRSLAMGDTKDDIRDLVFAVAPYAASVAVAAVLGWAAWTGYQLITFNKLNEQLQVQLTQSTSSLAAERAKIGQLPYEPKRVHNVIEIDDALDAGQIDILPPLQALSQALQTDAVVTSLKLEGAADTAQTANARAATAEKAEYVITARLKLAEVVTTADEAVNIARKLEARLNASFGKAYKIQMTAEPGAAQASNHFSGGLDTKESDAASGNTTRSDEPFYTEFRIAKVGP